MKIVTFTEASIAQYKQGQVTEKDLLDDDRYLTIISCRFHY
jgi:hypothetical protein